MKVEFISVENQTIQVDSAYNTRLTKSCKTPLSAPNLPKLSMSSADNMQPNKTTEPRQETDTKAKRRRLHCLVCKVSFPTKKAYELHKKNHLNSAKYKCDVCQQSFNSIDKLAIHARSHAGRYQCNMCQVCFTDVKDLDAHVLLHFDLDVRYKCGVCENSFFDLDHLVRHTDAVHSNTLNITFNCYVCGNLFASLHEFVKHDENHKKDSGVLHCSECGETFSTLVSLNLHRKIHAMPRTQPYACQKCSLRFSRSEDLHNHIRVHDGKSIYSCAICDRMFAHSKNLTNHVHKCHKTCFTADEMDLIDFVVEAELLERHNLDKVVSGDNVPVQVEGDVFRLNVRELVTKYMEKETPASTHSTFPLIEPSLFIPTNVTRKFTDFLRKYKCPLCELIFVKAKTLEIHCKRNHFGNYTLEQLEDIRKTADRNTSQSYPKAILNSRPNIVQKHECPCCSQLYESRNELISHLKVDHNGDAPYKCVECSETFTASNSLADHVLNHPVSRHECKYCGLTFSNLYSLGKHTKRHEGNWLHDFRFS